MAPEQARGGERIDGRADLYSLGAMLFELVTGRRPFVAAGAGQMLFLHQSEPAPLPSAFAPGLPKALSALLLQCLAKNPDDRPRGAAALRDELARLLPGLPERVLADLTSPSLKAERARPDAAPDADAPTIRARPA